MLCKQQSQLDSLLQQRNLLEQRIKILYDRWVSDVRLSEDQVSLMRRQLALAELAKLVEVTKADLVNGSKQRESLVYKLKLEHAESELNDFKAWFDILSHRCPDQEDISPNKLYESLKAVGGRDISSKGASTHHCKALENEVAKIKREYEKLSVKSSSDKSALQAEMNFVWNQYKEMESNYTDQLRTKSDEVDKANEKVMKLIESLEQLHSSNTDKDVKIQTLRADITKLEAESNKKDGEISRLRKELESLRSANTAGESVLKHCEPSSSNLKSRRANRNGGGGVAPEKEASAELPEATVATLRARITKLEAEASEKNEEISALSKEVLLLRSKNAAATPVLRRCTGEPRSSRSRVTRNGGNRGGVASSAELIHERDSKLSKRKQSDVVLDETPKLFTSQFKIPKLKTQSPLAR